MPTPEWIARCEPVGDAELDVGVSVWGSYYVGPENGFSIEQWRELRTPLYRPRVPYRAIRPTPRPGVWAPDVRYVSLASATRRELSELQCYFADVLRVMGRHGRQLRPADPLFHLRLGVFIAGDYAIRRNWHDRWGEIVRVLDALASPVEKRDVVYDDVEQGWQVTVFATPAALFMRQSNFETGEETRLITCRRESVVRQVGRLKGIMPALLNGLQARLGQPDLFGCPAAP